MSTTSPSAFDRLQAFFAERADAVKPTGEFREFEEELRSLLAEVEREALGDELARHDVDVPAVQINGRVHRRVLRGPASYLTRAGEVSVERTLYRAAEGERAVCPMELSAGIIEGYWSPWAAMLAVWAVAHMTSVEVEELMRRIGGMTPSSSTLDRLPRDLSARWEDARPDLEAAIRLVDPVPAEAVAVAVSLDGIMIPM